MNFSSLKQTWVVAEIGVNHEGSISLAERMIEQAAWAGADAVKFQTYSAERYISSLQKERLAAAKSRSLTIEQFQHLAGLASRLGLVFFTTPLSPIDADLCDSFTPIYKVASGELTWLPLIRHLASKKKPLILSTGGASLAEIAAAVEVVDQVWPQARQLGQLMLMHCVMAYPAPLESANLRNIATLEHHFNLPVGYSDHTVGIDVSQSAVAAGAVAIEKHFTYQKHDQQFRDHELSAEPHELQMLVKKIRQIEQALGSSKRTLQDEEAKILDSMRRSITAQVAIRKGEQFTDKNLTALRPAWGLPISKYYEVLGKSSARDLAEGEILSEEDIETYEKQSSK